jgi:hypothetical protein
VEAAEEVEAESTNAAQLRKTVAEGTMAVKTACSVGFALI